VVVVELVLDEKEETPFSGISFFYLELVLDLLRATDIQNS
jgi:hypothetical protein